MEFTKVVDTETGLEMKTTEHINGRVIFDPPECHARRVCNWRALYARNEEKLDRV